MMGLKILIFLFLVPFVTCTAVNVFEEWENWKNDYDKSYDSDSAEAHRYAIWKKNKKFIDDHNNHMNAFGYTLAMNQFGDLQTSEFADVFNGYKMRKQPNPTKLFTSPAGFVPQDTIDWRLKGAVTPVKEQKNCGSCWAFSATGSLEGQHFIKKGRLVSLSEQNLIDCSTSYGNEGCRGGDADRAFSYIQDNGGINTEDSYPYKAVDGICSFNPVDVGATDSGYVDLPERNETALMSAVSGIGPISVAIDASNDTFQFYHKGIYYEPTCSETNLDHAVLVVGYGTDEHGQDYWIVKNSWGIMWGTDGYMLMSRNRNNNCGIATEASFPKVD